jgi:hypothetical protein
LISIALKRFLQSSGRHCATPRRALLKRHNKRRPAPQWDHSSKPCLLLQKHCMSFNHKESPLMVCSLSQMKQRQEAPYMECINTRMACGDPFRLGLYPISSPSQ